MLCLARGGTYHDSQLFSKQNETKEEGKKRKEAKQNNVSINSV